MKIRLKDIAELANVSVATVSTILNNPNSNRFSASKREEILRLAKELNYVPNTTARSLVSNRSMTIGLMIPSLFNPFFAELAKTVESLCRLNGYTVIMVVSNEDYHNDLDLIRFLESRNVDGMLLALSGNSYGNEELFVELLESINTPYVLIDRVLDRFDCNRVIFNNKEGEFLATEHCILNGHHRIGYISVKGDSLSGHYRHLGYEKALRKYGIEYDETLVRYGKYDFETGLKFTKDLIDAGVSAIVCSNDLIAFGAIKVIEGQGLKMPEDVSVVGYDNLQVAEMFNVSLTSVDQNTEQLAQESVNILMEAISGDSSLKNIVLQTKLVVKGSVYSK